MTTKILIGHVLAQLANMPDESVHCVWTSPPYYALRDYGTEPQEWPTGWVGEHGQEPTMDLWLQHEVMIFREVRRVLRKDGILWLNIGDSYASTVNGRSADDQKSAGTDDRTFRDKPVNTVGGIFKPKDRMGQPHRLVHALQADGWWWRDEIVLHKLNPMPSSVKDRTCPAHEFLFMLTKSERYFYDHTAIQEPFSDDRQVRDYKMPDYWDTGDGSHGSIHRAGREKGRPASQRNVGGRTDGFTKPNNIDPSGNGGRLKRSVWSHALEPFRDAHFATAPTAWVRPCILAGTSQKGVCPHCAAPWQRVVSTVRESGFYPSCKCEGLPKLPKHPQILADWADQSEMEEYEAAFLDAEEARAGLITRAAKLKTIPATVFDPFGGAGTTALVAEELGRDAIMIELNPASAQMARKRLRENLGRVQSDMPEDRPNDIPLFEGAI